MCQLHETKCVDSGGSDRFGSVRKNGPVDNWVWR